MAELVFENVINLTTYGKNSEPKLVKKLMIGNEPSNDIWQYYMSSQNVRDKFSHIDYSNYTDITWNKPTHSITALRCSDFGMKTFPGIGAIGFYTPRIGASKVLVPIHVERKVKYTPPTLRMTTQTSTLTFYITPPKDLEYVCYRILLYNGKNTTFEYITYDHEVVVPKPTVKGTYQCWAIGYVDEGEFTSENSNILKYKVDTGTDTEVPLTPTYSLAANTYTKDEIDDMLGVIATLLDSINGEVI